MSFLVKKKGAKNIKVAEVVKHMRDALANLEKAGGNEKVIQKVPRFLDNSIMKKSMFTSFYF